MTEQPKKRPWFQIHLSTAVLLVLASSWLMHMNSIPEPAYVEWYDGHGVPPAIYRWDYGWPYLAILNSTENQFKKDFLHPTAIRTNCIVIDLIVAVAILFTIWFVCEWWIQWRSCPKRQWFQIHISTIVVLMFVAGVLIWANVVGQISSGSEHIFVRYGRPWDAVYQRTDINRISDEKNSYPAFIYGYSIIGDLAVSLIILFGVWFVSERWIRWCSSRKRPWQIHLSTAILLMFVSGGFLWVNIVPLKYNWTFVHEIFRNKITGQNRYYGWPCQFYGVTGSIPMDSPSPTYSTLGFNNLDLARSIGTNVLISGSVLFAVWFVCEWWIRWQESRKAEKQSRNL